MNIFIFDYDIQKNVISYPDKYIVKMPLELAQMISTAYRVLEWDNLPDFIFKATHQNHPCNKWVRETRQNFIYSCNLGMALYWEYQYRYNKPDKMQRVKQIFQYGLNNVPNFEKKELMPFAQAMPEKYKSENASKAYREYFKGEKQHLFKWSKRSTPEWITERG